MGILFLRSLELERSWEHSPYDLRSRGRLFYPPKAIPRFHTPKTQGGN